MYIPMDRIKHKNNEDALFHLFDNATSDGEVVSALEKMDEPELLKMFQSGKPIIERCIII